ncbi:DNA mismatch repair protein msh6 [Clydaea vesicula]|uniref:DNA mismatch repair protein n=1 Tax=Clydaea vesicula TaxID=447962 RepID=A0AAD5U4S0_9FUNG|nr:DNA mismatch repair protein msh6 [Clydaea vesicula]
MEYDKENNMKSTPKSNNSSSKQQSSILNFFKKPGQHATSERKRKLSEVDKTPTKIVVKNNLMEDDNIELTKSVTPTDRTPLANDSSILKSHGREVDYISTPNEKSIEELEIANEVHRSTGRTIDVLDEETIKRKRSRKIIIDDEEDDCINPLDSPEKMDLEEANLELNKTPYKKLQNFKWEQNLSCSSVTSTAGSSRETPTTPYSKLKVLYEKLFYNINFCLQGFSNFNTSPLTTLERKKNKAAAFKDKNNERYSWLLNIKDKERRPITDPDYDCRTLYIPASARNSMTDFERQYWDIKSEHFDTVVFFKKGKFFELFENDADIGHQEFDLKLTDRTNMRMVGVPESSFEHWAAQFVAKGYKVAKVEQMENSISKGLRERNDNSNSRKEKVIRRELTQVLTGGTLIDSGMLTDDMSTYCMAIKEKIGIEVNAEPIYGICFVDTATSEFNLSFFKDDLERTQLETLLLQIKPKELILEKGMVSQKFQRILKNNLYNPQVNYLIPKKEFLGCDETFDLIFSENYFKVEKVEEEAEAMAVDEGEYDFEQQRQDMMDALPECIKEFSENELAMSALGALMWVCHPLRKIDEINFRLDAIDDLCEAVDINDILKTCLIKLPDLERIISRVHSGTCKVKDFASGLNAFKALRSLLKKNQPHFKNFKNVKLKEVLLAEFPAHLSEELDYFVQSIDFEEALKNNNILVERGFDEEYDKSCKTYEDIEEELENERKYWEKKLGTKISFKDLGKEIYQMEFNLKVKVPNDFQQMSKTQSIIRYWSPKGKELVAELIDAKELREEALRKIKSKMFERFDINFRHWLNFIKLIGELDCLIGLSICKHNLGDIVCRPSFIESDVNIFDVKMMRHPCVGDGGRGDHQFVPNDTKLGGGGKEANIILLTGPNMGGKSTLLRQTCIAVIMAQLGCYVPASSLTMTTFDRIFTRIGANDNILAGQSTFMVELSETSKILREASPRSLVILDELGRGTSTFDGYAIAFSVLQHLALNVRCLGLFSTHYQMLTEEFKNNPIIKMMFMSFYSDEENRDITFLYKLVPGVCLKSYGMVVANMAGVPIEIINKADTVAEEFELSQKLTMNNSVDGEVEGKIDLLKLSCFKQVFDYFSKKECNIKDFETLKMLWRSLQK